MGANQSKREEPNYIQAKTKRRFKIKKKHKKRTKLPWRDTESQWDEQYSNKLLAEIREFNINIGTRDQRQMEKVMANVLFLGPTKAGKSSFVNSVLRISSRRLVTKAHNTDYEIGTGITKDSVYYEDGEVVNVNLHDTPGLMVEGDKEQGFNSKDFIPLIDGHMKGGYEFQSERSITEPDQYFRQYSRIKNKINCIVFVVDASTLDTIPDKYKQTIRDLQCDLINKGIPQVLLLTKCDKLCSLVRKHKDDKKYIFRCKSILKSVKYAESIFGIPQSFIHPVVNYCNEEGVALNATMNIPILLALRQMVHFAGDYVENQVHVGGCFPDNST